MNSTLRAPWLAALVIAGLAALLLAGGASAQAFARVSLTVVDGDGQPVVDVKITATTEGITTFHDEKVTNKKGKATFSFVDGTQVYNLHFEAAGYPALDIPLKPQIGGTMAREVVLQATAAASTDSLGAVPQARLRPHEELYNEGIDAVQANDIDLAIAKFRESLEKKEDFALAYSALAGLYFEREQYDDTLAAAGRLIELDPQNPRGYRLRYEAYKALGRDDEADAALAALKGLDQGGDTVALIYNDGVDALQQGNVDYAKARFHEALEIDPNLKQALALLGQLAVQGGNYQEALDLAGRALTTDPQYDKALRVRWEAYRGLGDAENEKAAFAALAVVNPQAVAVELYNEGAKLFEAGDTAGAQARFEKVLEVDPDHALAHYRLGICLVASHPAEAKQHLQRFIELDPDNAEASVAKEMISYLK